MRSSNTRLTQDERAHTHSLPEREWSPGVDDNIPPELLWRFDANCDGADENLFMMDEMLPGGSSISTRKANKEKFAIALQFCEGCSVRRQCDESARATGDHLWSVRGGVSPFDRDNDVTIRKPAPTKESAKLGDHVTMWHEFASGTPRDLAWRASDLPQAYARRALDQIVGFVMSMEPTAKWEAHKNPHHNTVKPGVGWVISTDETRNLVGVLTEERGRITRRVREVMKMTLSDGVNLSELPPLKVIPTSYF